MFYTYILYSESADRFYVGSTEDIQKRLQRHNESKVRSTKPFRPWKLVYSEEFNSRAEAMARENYIKSMKSRSFILQLIGKTRPD